jgi:hypothetical protein
MAVDYLSSASLSSAFIWIQPVVDTGEKLGNWRRKQARVYREEVRRCQGKAKIAFLPFSHSLQIGPLCFLLPLGTCPWVHEHSLPLFSTISPCYC